MRWEDTPSCGHTIPQAGPRWRSAQHQHTSLSASQSALTAMTHKAFKLRTKGNLSFVQLLLSGILLHQEKWKYISAQPIHILKYHSIQHKIHICPFKKWKTKDSMHLVSGGRCSHSNIKKHGIPPVPTHTYQVDPETPARYVTASNRPSSFISLSTPRQAMWARSPPPEPRTAITGAWALKEGQLEPVDNVRNKRASKVLLG